jgi:hypothetical protein
MSPETLRSVVEPFFAQSPETPLYISLCCERVYVGPQAPTMCRTCPKTPSPILLKSLAEIEQVAAQISS